jgi:superoxide reductase
MAERLEVFKCNVCGHIIEVLHTGQGELVCCNQPMAQLEENTIDAATEKHVPVIEKTDDGVVVKVGEVSHPMEDSHYIEWIEVISGDNVYRQFLNPGQTPEATFKAVGDQVTAREFCNLHGLWKA